MGRRIDGDALLESAQKVMKALCADEKDEVLSYRDLKKLVDKLGQDTAEMIRVDEVAGQTGWIWVQLWREQGGALRLEEGWGVIEGVKRMDATWVILRRLSKEQAGVLGLMREEYNMKRPYGWRCWTGKPEGDTEWTE